MQKFVVRLACVLALAALTAAASDEVLTYRGEIADSQCALNVHSLTRSHQEMLKSKAIGGTAAACAQYCIKYLGGEFVLSSKKEVYRLDNQSEAAKFTGQKVRVMGSMNSKGDSIHVVAIELDDKSPARQPAGAEKPVVTESGRNEDHPAPEHQK